MLYINNESCAAIIIIGSLIDVMYMKNDHVLAHNNKRILKTLNPYSTYD